MPTSARQRNAGAASPPHIVTLNQEYTAGGRPEEAVTDATNAWARTIQKATDQHRSPVLPAVPIDPTAFVEQ